MNRCRAHFTSTMSIRFGEGSQQAIKGSHGSISDPGISELAAQGELPLPQIGFTFLGTMLTHIKVLDSLLQLPEIDSLLSEG